MMVLLYSFHLPCGCVHHLLPAFQVPDLCLAALAGALQEGLLQLVLVLTVLRYSLLANWYCPHHAV